MSIVGERILRLEFDAFDLDAAVLCIAIHAFHAVITDFFRIEIASVTFTTSDAFPIVQDTHFMQGHLFFTPPGFI